MENFGVKESMVEIEMLYERLDSRWNSQCFAKKSIHRAKMKRLSAFLKNGNKMLDVCRGGSVDGILGVLAAERGLDVTICSTDKKYIDVIKLFAQKNGVDKEITYVVCDPSHLPFDNNSFDVVSSIHVLEHVMQINEALDELYRVTRKNAIIAMPTCLNICAMLRIGGSNYYDFTWKSIISLLIGIMKVIFAMILNRKGVFEVNEELGVKFEHLLRFPWTMKSELKRAGFKINVFGADGFAIPWITGNKIHSNISKLAYIPIVRNFGFGSHAYLSKDEV